MDRVEFAGETCSFEILEQSGRFTEYAVGKRTARMLSVNPRKEPLPVASTLASRLARASFRVALSGLSLATLTGCWVPLRSPAIPASSLPDHFRAPLRSSGVPLNFASLTIRPPADYILGTDDVLEVSVPDLYNGAEFRPMQVRIMSNGEISLPLVGKIRVAGMNVLDAQQTITAAYANGILKEPRVNVSLFQKATIDVLVLGEVNNPGVHALPRYQNDVGHAIASAGGLTQDAAGEIEVHRSSQDGLIYPEMGLQAEEVITQGEATPSVQSPAEEPTPAEEPAAVEESPAAETPASEGGSPPLPGELPQSSLRRLRPVSEEMEPEMDEREEFAHIPDRFDSNHTLTRDSKLKLASYGDPAALHPSLAPCQSADNILRIPLRGMPSEMISEASITLHPGSVVVVPSRKHEVFWVVGRLSNTNLVRFTLGNRERELGAGLVLPRDRDIDVVTAVAMAGYIDPIESPSTVVVHRTRPDGTPFLIGVDLIAARYDRRETVMVEPGDIIYVTPDFPWWFRHTFERVVPDIITIPYAQSVFRWFGTDQR